MDDTNNNNINNNNNDDKITLFLHRVDDINNNNIKGILHQKILSLKSHILEESCQNCNFDCIIKFTTSLIYALHWSRYSGCRKEILTRNGQFPRLKNGGLLLTQDCNDDDEGDCDGDDSDDDDCDDDDTGDDDHMNGGDDDDDGYE